MNGGLSLAEDINGAAVPHEAKNLVRPRGTTRGHKARACAPENRKTIRAEREGFRTQQNKFFRRERPPNFPHQGKGRNDTTEADEMNGEQFLTGKTKMGLRSCRRPKNPPRSGGATKKNANKVFSLFVNRDLSSRGLQPAEVYPQRGRLGATKTNPSRSGGTSKGHKASA